MLGLGPIMAFTCSERGDGVKVPDPNSPGNWIWKANIDCGDSTLPVDQQTETMSAAVPYLESDNMQQFQTKCSDTYKAMCTARFGGAPAKVRLHMLVDV